MPSLDLKSIIKSKSLYSEGRMLFSNSQISNVKPVFRAPGIILENKPIITQQNSILSEDGVLYYYKVTSASSIDKRPLSWFLLKRELINMSQINDCHELIKFIHTDIVTSINKRTNYLLYQESKATGLFLGSSIGICINGNIIKVLEIKKNNFQKDNYNKILLDDSELKFSCEEERDAWYELILEINA